MAWLLHSQSDMKAGGSLAHSKRHCTHQLENETLHMRNTRATDVLERSVRLHLLLDLEYKLIRGDFGKQTDRETRISLQQAIELYQAHVHGSRAVRKGRLLAREREHFREQVVADAHDAVRHARKRTSYKQKRQYHEFSDHKIAMRMCVLAEAMAPKIRRLLPNDRQTASSKPSQSPICRERERESCML